MGYMETLVSFAWFSFQKIKFIKMIKKEGLGNLKRFKNTRNISTICNMWAIYRRNIGIWNVQLYYVFIKKHLIQNLSQFIFKLLLKCI